MEKDFYLDERWLASYFEKDWSDYVVRNSQNKAIQFEYPEFDSKILYSKYHYEFVQFLNAEIQKSSMKPESILEIGSSLGRTFYELCLTQTSLRRADLVEPSQLLASGFAKIFQGTQNSVFPMLVGNRELQNIEFNSQNIRNACAFVDFRVINSAFQEIKPKPYDLVICSNVIDQCHEPLALIDLLKESTSDGGLLTMSCTYQWNDKYIEPSKQTITNVADLFGNDWILLAEKDIEFKCRRSERHWMTFLSHALIFRKG